MEISKLYEEAAAKLEKAADVCAKSEINLTSLTLVCTKKGNVYTGINWRTLNDSFEEETTCSEREAIAKMLLAGESVIESIVTLDPSTKNPVNPCQKCLELIISIDLANTSCKIISGKNSHMVITSLNNDIAKYAETLALKYQAEQTEKIDAVINEVSDGKMAEAMKAAEAAALAMAEVSSDETPTAENPFVSNQIEGNPFMESAPAEPEAPTPVLNPSVPSENTAPENIEKAVDGNDIAAENNKPQGSAAHTGGNFNTADLQMLLSDDWESPSETETAEENKPFNASSLSTNQQEIINTVQNMSEDMQNQQNNPYTQQSMNNMYQQQPMNGMYQQQAMNGMYQQQPMNGMNGMYQQQPMNGMYQQQPMNGMYQQQPMNGMYQQQPMNGMYQQQPMNGMYQQQPMNGMYQQQPMNNMYQQQPMNGMYQQQASTGSMYMNQIPRAQQNSVYLNQPQSQQSQQNSNNSSVYLNRMQAPISTGTQRPNNATQSMSVYGKNANGDNNAIFKDRLNDILNSGSQKAETTSMAMEDVMQSAKDKKKAAKKNKK